MPVNLNTEVVVAKEPIPSVSKKLVTNPVIISAIEGAGTPPFLLSDRYQIPA